MKIKLKTISPVILSPRTEKALYKDVDFKEILEKDMENLKTGKIDNTKIVYPFYSYDDRNLLSENPFSPAKKYYIPASSLKGALLGSKKDDSENRLRNKILFQDIDINKEKIKLRILYKFQYLYQESEEQINDKKLKNPKFTPFFPNVAIEMMDINEEFEVQILLKEQEISEKFLKERLKENFSITEKKLKNYIEEIEEIIKNISSWEKKGKIKIQYENSQNCITILKNIKNNIQIQAESKKNILFLGGYKGILGSLFQFDKKPKVKNGFYIDEYTLLPYGLVSISFK